jgi:lysophospholipase L1-like esterase
MSRAALVAFNTLLLLALCEGGARVAEWARPESDDLTFDYAPYRMLRMARGPWPLNREGFRARELESYRHSFLVVFLGGSVCLGVGTNPGPAVPERLEEALHRAGMNEAAVLNLCQGGAPSAQELAIFLEYGLPLGPQVVLSFNGANDLMHPRPVGEDSAANLPYRNSEIAARLDAQHGFGPHLALMRVAGRIARRGGSARASGPAVPPEAILNSYLYSTEVVRTLTVSQGGLHAVLLQPTVHYQKPWSEEEAAMWRARRPVDGGEISRYVSGLFASAAGALRQWSAETGAPLFDLTPVFARTPETVYSDSVHFTGERGYRMIHEELVRQGLLEKIAARYQAWDERRRTGSQRSSVWPR